MEVQTRGHIRRNTSLWRAGSREDSQSTQFLSHPIEAPGASDSSAAAGGCSAGDGPLMESRAVPSSGSSCSRLANHLVLRSEGLIRSRSRQQPELPQARLLFCTDKTIVSDGVALPLSLQSPPGPESLTLRCRQAVNGFFCGQFQKAQFRP